MKNNYKNKNKAISTRSTTAGIHLIKLWNYNTNRDKVAVGFLLKKPKYFEVMLNIFELPPVRENVEY